MICAGQGMLVGGELKSSGTDRKREIHRRNWKYTQNFSL